LKLHSILPSAEDRGQFYFALDQNNYQFKRRLAGWILESVWTYGEKQKDSFPEENETGTSHFQIGHFND
jgi:hypothetical protein